MNPSFKLKAKKSTLKDSSHQLLLYLNTCSINDKDLFLKKCRSGGVLSTHDFLILIKTINLVQKFTPILELPGI